MKSGVLCAGNQGFYQICPPAVPAPRVGRVTRAGGDGTMALCRHPPGKPIADPTPCP